MIFDFDLDYKIEDLNYHPDDNIIAYQGNPNVKAAGSTTVITKERALEIAKCMEDPVYFCKTYLKIITLDHGLQPFIPRPYQERAIATILNNRFVIIKQGRQSGKALCLDTDIPTIDGWKTIKDIVPGDTVFDMDGNPTKVTFVSEDHFKDTYRFTLADGSVVDSCVDHQWEVYDHYYSKHSDRVDSRNNTKTVTTRDIIDNGLFNKNKRGEYRYFVPVAKPAQYERKELPLDPYILGAWLGDGSSSSGNITVHRSDLDSLLSSLNLEDNGFKYSVHEYCTHNKDVLTLVVHGLYNKLKSIGVLNNKHIPDMYLQSCYEQRLALLQGLMDTDGHANIESELEITFTNKNPKLIADAHELIRSMGVKTRLYEYNNTPHPSTHISFMVSRDKMECFRFERKLVHQRSKPTTPKVSKIAIVKAEKIETKITRCLTVDSPTSTFLCTKNFIVTHNTATTAAVMTWLLIFNKEYTIACLAHKQDQAIEIIDRIKTYYENIPLWLQIGVKAWNRKSIRLQTKTEVFAAATGSGSVRGRTLNFVFCDEFAIVPSNIAEDFYTGTFPTISSGTETKFVIASTPKGFNLFYKIWQDAEEGKSDFVPFSINWWDVPGRDEAWRAAEIARTSEATFSQEYETEFLGSSNTLITGKKLGEIAYRDPVMMDETKRNLFIFTQPVRGRNYIICADVSEGVGGDSSSFIVMDVTEMPYHVVATYDNDMLDPLYYPNVLFDIGTYYNHAHIAIENNTIGHGVVNTLYQDLEYPNIISTNTKLKKKDDIMEGGRQVLGIRQTTSTRHKGNATLKTLIENDQLFVTDFRIFYQLSRYIRKGGKFQASPGDHDDLVMCLVIFAYLTTLDTFKEITGTDISLAMNQRALYEQQHLPLGVFVDSGLGQHGDSLSFNDLSEFDQWLIQ